VHDPVAIALEWTAQPAGGFDVAPTTAAIGLARIAGNMAHAAIRPTGATRRTMATV
jgi:hypothetical protein